WSLWVAMPLAVLLSGAFGWAMDVTMWRPMRRRGIGIVQLMIFTIGLSLALRYVFQYFIGGGTYQLPGSAGEKIQILGRVQLSVVDMVSMGISVAVLVFVAWWLLKTRIGK